VEAAGAAAAHKWLESTDAFFCSPPPFLPALVAMPNRSLVAHPVLCATALVNGVSPAACLIAELRNASVHCEWHCEIGTNRTGDATLAS
jgi:hypothetical protein